MNFAPSTFDSLGDRCSIDDAAQPISRQADRALTCLSVLHSCRDLLVIVGDKILPQFPMEDNENKNKYISDTGRLGSNQSSERWVGN